MRSLAHRENNHLVATHHVLTGHQQPGAFFDKIASRDDWPCYSAGLNYFRPRADGLPGGVNLPTFLVDGYVGGSWLAPLRGKAVLTLTPYVRLDAPRRRSVEAEAEALLAWLRPDADRRVVEWASA